MKIPGMKDPKLWKSIIVSAVVILLGYVGLTLVVPSAAALSATTLTSAVFLTAAIGLAAVALAYDLFRGKKLYWKDAIVAGLVVALVFSTIAVGFGVPSINANLLVAAILLIVSVYIGIEVADMLPY